MKKWNILSTDLPQNTSELTNLLLKNRGIIKQKDKELFLNPSLQNISLESVGIDKNQSDFAVKRIKEAIKKNETILIFGDYDVDGVTGTAILWETLYWNLGYRNVHPYIPHRVNEGYGISEKGIDAVLLEFPKTTLIITVDNGIVANKPIEYAKNKGIDVIITDHHTPSSKNPSAFSIVHTTKLCGASVAFMLSLELEGKEISRNDPRLDLVALATVADLVPLTDDNRTFLTFGLDALRNSKRPGIQALVENCAIEQKNIGVYEIGHMLAPRLNAAGRLEHAMDSLRLLCTKDPLRARQYAHNVSQVNKQRQVMTEELILFAKNSVVIAKDTKILISSSDEYNQGVIGLVASRLTEEYYRPALVISKGEDISKGSARSIKGVNIIELIRSASTYLTEVGGHPMAAGFSLKTKHLELFAHEIIQKAEQLIGEEHFQRSVTVDCELSLKIIEENLLSEIQKLAPFGMGNYEPIFLTKNIEVIDVKKIGKDSSHLKLKLSKDGKEISAIGFGMAGHDDTLKARDHADFVYVISLNEWNGTKTLQLIVKDYKKIKN